MTTIADIGWGRYLDHEGPYYRGNQPYVLPQNPTKQESYLAVITATEGGSANAINMYDRCGVSLGWIQWCEFGQFSVSALLGAYAVATGAISLQNMMATFGVSLVQTARDSWKLSDGGGVADTIDKQRRLFFLNATGELGSWDDASKAHAKGWASALATLFEDEKAKRVQLDYTTARLDKFVLPNARILKPGDAVTSPWPNVAYAAYLSFAANNPAIASRMLQAHVTKNGFLTHKQDWVIGLLKQLTFSPKIAIYPSRYDKIRPILEKCFGVDLPDFSKELATWQAAVGVNHSDSERDRLDTTNAVQVALLYLGFDLGPAGADGVFGAKTRQALITFQRQNGLDPDGLFGPDTHRRLASVLEDQGF